MTRDTRLDAVLPIEVRERVRRPVEDARSLPRQAFFSEEIHQLELERVFSAGWMSLGFSGEVPVPGDVVPRSVSGIPLLITRDVEGVLHVLHNVCPRDGCLAVPEAARGWEGIIGPYHGWRWHLDGRLENATLYDGTPAIHTFADGRFDLRAVEHAEWMGVVFVNLSGRGIPFEEMIAPVAELYADVDLSPLAMGLGEDDRVLTTELVFEANWKTVYENFAININHEAFVHRMYEAAPNVPRTTDTGERLFEEIDDRGHQGLRFEAAEGEKIYGAPFLPRILLTNSEPLSQHTIMSLYPNTNISLFPDHLCVSVLIPEGPERTRYLTAAAFVGETATAEESREARQGLLAAWLGAAREDAEVCRAVQAGRRSPAFEQHAFVPFWERLYHSFSQRILDDLERSR